MSKAMRAYDQEVLLMSSNQMSALADLLYSIATGENVVSLAPNHREELMEMYSDAFWFGRRLDK